MSRKARTFSLSKSLNEGISPVSNLVGIKSVIKEHTFDNLAENTSSHIELTVFQ
jgi:hypothetical protein